ncbi:MAG: hypothetical protein JNK78_14885 [Planctomycetes bacterium]|nr:hypothetical protein [Planctomycetota bacterium]
MSLTNKFFPLALLTLTVAAEAQGTFGTYAIQFPTTVILQPVPPTLPSVEYKNGGYDKSIGNSWLGGSVHTYVGMVRQKSGTYELGYATAEFRGAAKVLNHSVEVAEIVGLASNVMNNGVQNRSGSFRVDVLGYSVVNQSFQNNSTFGASTSTFNLLGPSGVSASVPCGPISVTISGNAGCSFSRSANWLLPAATSTVGLNASGSAWAFANASVSFGIPGFNLGVGLQGKILEQTLGINLSSSGLWGLSGGASYTLKAITLQLYAWATAIWTWTTNLCSWTAGQITLTLI